MVVDGPADADAARFGETLQTRGYVDAITVNVVAIDDDLAEINANPEPQFAVVGVIPVTSLELAPCSTAGATSRPTT